MILVIFGPRKARSPSMRSSTKISPSFSSIFLKHKSKRKCMMKLHSCYFQQLQGNACRLLDFWLYPLPAHNASCSPLLRLFSHHNYPLYLFQVLYFLLGCKHFVFHIFFPKTGPERTCTDFPQAGLRVKKARTTDLGSANLLIF